MKLKKSDMPKFARMLERHVNNVLLAQVIAEHKREQVDKIHRRVLAENNYQYDTERWGVLDVSGKVTEPSDTYLMRESDSADYFAKMKAIHLANGYADAEKGYCPALVAEHMLIQAQNVLLEVASEPMGVDLTGTCGDNRKKALDLLIGLVTNMSWYVAPNLKGEPCLS